MIPPTRRQGPRWFSAAPARPAGGSSSGSARTTCRCASARAAPSRRSTGRTARPGDRRSTASARSTSPISRTSRCPGALDTVGALTRRGALAAGARRLVLLSGRGEEEAARAEAVLVASRRGLDDPALQLVRAELQRGLVPRRDARGELALPVDAVPEPFVDVEDVADAAFAALTDDAAHIGRLYEMTGPRALQVRRSDLRGRPRQRPRDPVPQRAGGRARRGARCRRRPGGRRGVHQLSLRHGARRAERVSAAGGAASPRPAAARLRRLCRQAAAAGAWS